MDRREFLGALGLAYVALTQDAPEKEIAAMRAFLGKPKEAQHKLIAALRAELATMQSPWLARCASLAEKGRSLLLAKPPAGWQHRTPKNEMPSPWAELPFAVSHEYLWGYRQVRALERRQPLVAGHGKDTLKLPADPVAEELLAALRGLPADLDLAIAAATAELDTDARGDRFAVFLEEWRNGNESFYRALDRTAGTNEAVFYFDAMLSEFNKRFAPEDQRKSLKQLHDDVHDAFLVWRQHRAMREAVACAALLPPHVALPSHLARYDKEAKGYSLRDDVAILLRLARDEPQDVLELVRSTAAPLPDPLWSTRGKHDSLAPLQQAFHARVAAELATSRSSASSTDAMLRDARAVRAAASDEIRAKALAALAGA